MFGAENWTRLKAFSASTRNCAVIPDLIAKLLKSERSKLRTPCARRIGEKFGSLPNENAAGWLAELGDPYRAVGADRDGRVAIDWGVYGVPETFVIDRAGRIRYRFVGPLQPRDLDETLRPLLAQLEREQPRDPLVRVEGKSR